MSHLSRKNGRKGKRRMTNEEAVLVLTNSTIFIKDAFSHMKDAHVEQFKEAYRMAIIALEKDVPKKRVTVPVEESKLHSFKCPTCGGYNLGNRCNDCGQLLY